MVAQFTIGFIASNELDLMRQTIPHNLKVLTESTTEQFDAILLLDGSSPDVAKCVTVEAPGWGIDELRVRHRRRNVATGDKSNNAHVHMFSDKSEFLITMECDVAAFVTHETQDVLKSIKKEFLKCPALALATRIDDYDCWAEPLQFLSPPISPNVRSVSRVSSHFLAYHCDRFRSQVKGRVSTNIFQDDGVSFYNYEDFISQTFRRPQGKGIGYLDRIGVKVFHCDRKVSAGSPFYTGDERLKLAEFERLRALHEDCAEYVA